MTVLEELTDPALDPLHPLEAAIDRLVHDRVILELTAPSYRLEPAPHDRQPLVEEPTSGTYLRRTPMAG